jgi:hypothetical protein
MFVIVNYKYFKAIFPIKVFKALGSGSNPRIQLFTYLQNMESELSAQSPQDDNFKGNNS